MCSNIGSISRVCAAYSFTGILFTVSTASLRPRNAIDWAIVIQLMYFSSQLLSLAEFWGRTCVGAVSYSFRLWPGELVMPDDAR